MTHVAAFLAGFASGFVARGTVDSSRTIMVGAIAAAYGAYDRAKRFVAIEREHLEDLVAEGKAQFEAKRARTARRTTTGPRAADVGPVAPAADVSRVREGRAA
jgi:hypothetical protein